MAKEMKVSAKTIMNLKGPAFGMLVGLIFLMVVCAGTSVVIGFRMNAIAGGLCFLASIFVPGYFARELVKDPKNQKTCTSSFFYMIEGVKNPVDPDEADTELDITLCLAQKNAQYKRYAGVWTTSNAATETGNVDAFYIPFSDEDERTTIRLTRGVITSKDYGTAYTKKGTKDDPGPRIIMSSPAPSPGGSPPAR